MAMMAVLKLKDDRVETVLGQWDFDRLVKEYMGLDAFLYYQDTLIEYEEKLRDLKRTADKIAWYVLEVLLPGLDPPDREEWADDIRSKMEEFYGL